MSLEEKRVGLQDELNSLSDKIDALKKQLVTGVPTAAPKYQAPSRPAAPAAKPAARGSKPGKAGRGELKSRIFSALEQAGSSGVKVLDLARSLDTNPANIYAWFHAAVKRYPQIKKVGSAEYRLGGGAPSKSAATKPAARPQQKPAKAAKAAKPSTGPAGGTKRGALQAKIIDALKSAGASGITVKALADKFRMPYRNVQVWFATTGKKQPGIKKVAPATYRYAG